MKNFGLTALFILVANIYSAQSVAVQGTYFKGNEGSSNQAVITLRGSGYGEFEIKLAPSGRTCVYKFNRDISVPYEGNLPLYTCISGCGSAEIKFLTPNKFTYGGSEVYYKTGYAPPVLPAGALKRDDPTGEWRYDTGGGQYFTLLIYDFQLTGLTTAQFTAEHQTHSKIETLTFKGSTGSHFKCDQANWPLDLAPNNRELMFQGRKFFRNGPTPPFPNYSNVASGASAQTGAALSGTSVNTVSPSTKTAKIHDAAKTGGSGGFSEVKKLVMEQGADPDIKDADQGRTAMHYAAMKGDENSNKTIDFLIKTGHADVNISDNQGKTALDLSLEKSNFETAKILLENGANAGKAKAGLDRIMATQDESDLLKLFLQNGADGDYAMSKAIANDHDEMLRVVVDNSNIRANNLYFQQAIDQRSMKSAAQLLKYGINNDQAMDYVIQKDDKSMVVFVLDKGSINAETATKTLVFASEHRDLGLAERTIMEFYANPTAGMAPAVVNNHTDMIGLLLSKGADPNDQMDEASRDGKKDIVQSLLGYSANPNLGIEPAATNNQISTLQLLLDAQGDANIAMPIAIEKGDVTMVNMCISASKPADVFRSEYIVTTCEKSNLDILGALLMAGADPNPGMPISIEKGDSELVRELVLAGAQVQKPEYILSCATRKDASVAQILLDKGANPNPGMQKSIDLADANMISMFLKYNADATPPALISKASGMGQTSIVTMLLDYNADPNNGMLEGIKNNKLDVVTILLKRGADGRTDNLIVESVKHNNTALTGLLLNAGANPQVAIGPAVTANSNKVVSQLADNGVNIAETSYLVTCVLKNHVRTARVIIDAGTSAAGYWDDSKGMSLLHLSISMHISSEMAGLLIGAGADVNKETSGGDSPMHIAVQHGKKKTDQTVAVLDVLINAGGDVNAINSSGQTVLKAAPNKRPITKILKAAGAQKKL